MRFKVLVATRHDNDMAPHIHIRNIGIRPGKIASVFAETVHDEYERLSRGLRDEDDAQLDGYGNLDRMDITGVLKTSTGISITRIYVEEV